MIFQNFHSTALFHDSFRIAIDCYHFGDLWLSQAKGLNPVVFTNSQDDYSVIDKYSSLTSMMLTIAECYELGIYDNYIFNQYSESENKIWHKYNFELREFALQILQEKPFCQLTWIYIVYELVEFKDLRACQFLIEWLSGLIGAYKEQSYRIFHVGIDSKLD